MTRWLRAISSGQDSSILTARVATHGVGFALTCPRDASRILTFSIEALGKLRRNQRWKSDNKQSYSLNTLGPVTAILKCPI